MTEDTSSRAPAFPRTPAATAEQRPIWKHGVIAAVVAAIATTVLAAIASAAGVSFSQGTSESIPVPMFTVLTLVFSLIGVGIATLIARKARKPRATFVKTVIGLLLLSFVPDLTFGFDAGSTVTLMALHSVAALIVVPVLARRLPVAR